jgi:hypothetical protein
METALVYVPLPDAELERLVEASEASGRSIDELVQEAIARFLAERES